MNFDYRGIWGVDISTYQDSPLIVGHTDFQRMKDGGARFVIIKASQGNFEDVDFDINWINSKRLLPHAPYHYYDNGVTPKVQALKFWETIKGDIDGICWFDLEDGSLGTYGRWQDWYDCIIEFQRLSKLPDSRIGIYTRRSYWIERTVTANYEEKKWFGKFHLWLATYPDDPFNPDYSKILIPFPWMDDEVILLQLGTPAIGLALGVESKEIDYDRFNGDEVEFQFMFGGTLPPIGDAMQEGTVIVTKINIRQGPGSVYSDIGDLFRGDKIYGDGVDISTGWFSFNKIVRLNGTVENMLGWAVVRDTLGTLCLTIANVAPAPEVLIPDYILAHFPDGTTKKYIPE